MSMQNERIFSESSRISLWNRLEILTSVNGVKNELMQQLIYKYKVYNELIDEKSKGIAFCIRSAKDYFCQISETNITASFTMLYYGTYNLLSALLIREIDNNITLPEVENLSKNGGHGLKAIYTKAPTTLNPDNEKVFIHKDGFYPNFLNLLGYGNISDFAFISAQKSPKNIEEIPKDQKTKFFSFKDLLSRIPELENLYLEIFKEHPNYLYYRVDYKNLEDLECKLSVSLRQNSFYLNPDKIKEILDLDQTFDFDQKNEGTDIIYTCNKLVSKSKLPLKLPYRSALAKDCYVQPLLYTSDILLIYFKILYMLSIWTRYRPNLLREICEGKDDLYKSLLINLITAGERIIPNLFLNKFYKKNFIIGGHSYIG